MPTNTHTPPPASAAAAPATWTVDQFAAAAGVSRSLLYDLPADHWPRAVKLGRRRLIIEAPGAWLQRIADAQRAAA